MVPEHIRPLRITELVDAAFATARRSVSVNAPLTVLVVAPIEILVWFSQYTILRNTGTSSITVGSITFNGATSVLVGALQLIALAVAVAACVPASLDVFSGGMLGSWRSFIGRFLGRLGAVVVVLVIGGAFAGISGLVLGAVAGVPALFVGGLAGYVLGGVGVVIAFTGVFGPLALFVAWYAPALPALFNERLTIGRAVSRGFQLGTRRVFPYAAAMLMLFAVSIIAWLSLQTILALLLRDRTLGSELVDTGLSVALGTAITVLVAPVFAGLITAMYFDARVRRDGLDLAWAIQGWDE